MASKTDKRNERRGGFYWIENQPYVSVTNVLKVIDKPALRRWFGREVYIAMSKDPTLDENEALGAPYKVSSDAKERGSTIHSIVESYKHTKEHIKTVPKKYRGYAEAFYSWVDDYEMEIQDHEKTVVSRDHKYAGTLDMLTKNKSDEWVIDVKTGKDIYDEAHLQISAYLYAVNEGIDIPERIVNRGGVLLLREDGKYKFGETPDAFEYFLAAKKLWEWNNRELLEKVGYYKGGE